MGLLNSLKNAFSKKCVKCKRTDPFFRCKKCGSLYCKECCKKVAETIRNLVISESVMFGNLPDSQEVINLQNLCSEQESICPKCDFIEFNSKYAKSNNARNSVKRLSKSCIPI
jgi:hypothetical protein